MAEPLMKIDVEGDRAVIARISAIPDKVYSGLRTEIMAQALKTEGEVKRKLSGDVLNVVTGTLRASIYSRFEEATKERVAASVQSGGVAYAGIHEFGGVIPAHEVVAKAGGMLRFEIAGVVYYRKRVFIPDVKMPERSYLRSTLRERTPEIIEGIRGVVERATRG